ncbi:conserved hypothetical protein [Formosa agariphila KMM 3901]|uniref:Lipoprotein n=1 Tax=Formosa agariphila (strain DSM 15362 / KCTC 12365 / LMG 23005 / KMM 3901 / M-2Alg 35-1) TaxID=1347342 RepID=T2KR54_FORAG|nr:hypothetical protein [Formosa agariphila]CDF80998.1 conserved hypothetical protein [Formosa agariphila KMM 3901]
MKHFTILLSIVLFSACGLSKNSSATAQNKTTSTKIETAPQNVLIIYSAITRGAFLDIKIEDYQISVRKSQYGPDKIQDISKTEWDILMNKLNRVDLNTLSTLKAPSAQRHTDGALSARLHITENNLKYSTTEFDHKNPNSEIKPLVDYIIALAEEVE